MGSKFGAMTSTHSPKPYTSTFPLPQHGILPGTLQHGNSWNTKKNQEQSQENPEHLKKPEHILKNWNTLPPKKKT